MSTSCLVSEDKKEKNKKKNESTRLTPNHNFSNNKYT